MEKNKIFDQKLQKTSKLLQEKPAALKREHSAVQNMKYFFLFLLVPFSFP